MTDQSTEFKPDTDFQLMQYFARLDGMTGTPEEIATKQAALRASYRAWNAAQKAKSD